MGLQKDALLQTVFRRGLEQGVFLQGVVSRVVMGERHASGFRVVMKRVDAVPGLGLWYGLSFWRIPRLALRMTADVFLPASAGR